jgi:hypothetical protein
MVKLDLNHMSQKTCLTPWKSMLFEANISLGRLTEEIPIHLWKLVINFHAHIDS